MNLLLCNSLFLKIVNTNNDNVIRKNKMIPAKISNVSQVVKLVSKLITASATNAIIKAINNAAL